MQSSTLNHKNIVSHGLILFQRREFRFVTDLANGQIANRPRSIYQYSNMAPRLSGQTSIFGVAFFVSKSLLGIERRKKLKKFTIFTRKPRSHVRILIYRTWPIVRPYAPLGETRTDGDDDDKLQTNLTAYRQSTAATMVRKNFEECLFLNPAEN